MKSIAKPIHWFTQLHPVDKLSALFAIAIIAVMCAQIYIGYKQAQQGKAERIECEKRGGQIIRVQGDVVCGIVKLV